MDRHSQRKGHNNPFQGKVRAYLCRFAHNIAPVIASNTNLEINRGIAIKLPKEDIAMTRQK